MDIRCGHGTSLHLDLFSRFGSYYIVWGVFETSYPSNSINLLTNVKIKNCEWFSYADSLEQGQHEVVTLVITMTTASQSILFQVARIGTPYINKASAKSCRI